LDVDETVKISKWERGLGEETNKNKRDHKYMDVSG
jgi:hypothetical protein